jgi:uncharacterized membrane protein
MSRRRAAAWLAFGPVLILAGLALRLPPDGHEHGNLGQFLGRFHVALIHLPIAFLTLVPLLELGGSFRPWAHLRAAAGFVLGLAAASAVAAAWDGWILARFGGYSGALVSRHMWGGIALAALIVLATFSRLATRGWLGAMLIYVPLLAATLGVMIWTSDQGGQITHGDHFLTQYMPRRIRVLLHLPPPPTPAPSPTPPAAQGVPTFYAARIAPLFQKSCVSCHNPRKAKGGLLLDTYAGLMKGGEDGAAIVPWYPGKSELVRRIELPSDDDDFMPSNGKNPLSTAEAKTIELWIAAGASAAEPADAGK